MRGAVVLGTELRGVDVWGAAVLGTDVLGDGCMEVTGRERATMRGPCDMRRLYAALGGGDQGVLRRASVVFL